jgi:hypothetical protein
MKTFCQECWGGTVAHAREKLLRSQGKRITCMECGERLAKEVKHTIVPMNKSNYIPVTNYEILKQLNPKRTI